VALLWLPTPATVVLQFGRIQRGNRVGVDSERQVSNALLIFCEAQPVPGELIRWRVLGLCNIVTFSSPDRLDFSFLFLNVTDLKGIRAGRHFRSR
jgi:hypothetical protein